MPLDFYKFYKTNEKPWLLAGMGPSFSERSDIDLTSYNILGINKVCREIPVELCQIIDFYIVDKIADRIYENSKYLVMPYFPHFQCRPFYDLTIYTLINSKPFLKKMDREGRLLCFNLSTVRRRMTDSPIVTAKFFSAEAAVSLIANLGVKTIRTIGIDGGTKRADEFSDHGPCDPRGFDIQWAGINFTINKHCLDYQALKGESDGIRQNIKPTAYGNLPR